LVQGLLFAREFHRRLALHQKDQLLDPIRADLGGRKLFWMVFGKLDQSVGHHTAEFLLRHRRAPPSLRVVTPEAFLLEIVNQVKTEQEYFADGMVEEIITALARFKSLFVIARNSSFAYKGKAVDIKQVGRDLGVRYVLEGSIRKAGGKVRITGQLIEATTGAHFWADKFDGGIEDVFDLQDQVATSVASAIAPRLEQAEIERAKRKPTESLDAYDYYTPFTSQPENPWG